MLRRIAIITAALLPLAAVDAMAGNALVVRDAWIRSAPPNAPVLAGYMTLENRSEARMVLLGATSPAFGEIMIHRTEEAQGVASMTHQSQVAIAPHEKLVFQPGGYHLMLGQARQTLHVYGRVPIELEFGGGMRVSVSFVVRKDTLGEPVHQH